MMESVEGVVPDGGPTMIQESLLVTVKLSAAPVLPTDTDCGPGPVNCNAEGETVSVGAGAVTVRETGIDRGTGPPVRLSVPLYGVTLGLSPTGFTVTVTVAGVDAADAVAPSHVVGVVPAVKLIAVLPVLVTFTTCEAGIAPPTV